MNTKIKRNRSKLRHIPEGSEIYADGSWFFKFTDPKEVRGVDGTIIGAPIGFGEMICNAE
jgi:hypothetical protein